MNSVYTAYQSCTLCPRYCGVDRTAGEVGICGASDDVYIARAALHYWEEPPISGESGSGTVFFSRCSLQCCYCQNRLITLGEKGYKVSEDGLVEAFLSLQKEGALNINLVTGTHYIPSIVNAVEVARNNGLELPIVWNTSSYDSSEGLALLDGQVDVYLADYKYADNALALAYSKAQDYPEIALQALEIMLAQVGEPQYDEYQGQTRMTKGVLVRHLILPGAIDNSLAALEKLYKRFGNAVLYSLMNQYTPVLARASEEGDSTATSLLGKYPELGATVSSEDYERVLDFADSLGIEDYFWQEGGACEESFIPEFFSAPAPLNQ